MPFVGPSSLGAIHLASAILADADVVPGDDERLLRGCNEFGLPTGRPS